MAVYNYDYGNLISEKYLQLRSKEKRRLSKKLDKLVSGENIKTINGVSILGSDDISINGIVDIVDLEDGTIVITTTNNTYTFSTVTDTSNYYTKEEIDLKGYLTEHQDISAKADASDVYTKLEINDIIGDIETLLAAI